MSYYREPLRGTFAGSPDQMDQEKEKEEKKKGKGGPAGTKVQKGPIRIKGYINNRYPDARANYDGSMEMLRKEFKKPVYGKARRPRFCADNS